MGEHSAEWIGSRRKPTCAGSSSQPRNIAFESPEVADDQEWDFLLFQPSAQHTAALCLQRSSEPAPALSDTRFDSSSAHSLDSSHGSLSRYAESSCDQSDLSDESQTCMEASSASSTASRSGGMLATATQEPPPAESQASAPSERWHSGNRSSLDSQDYAEVESSGMPGFRSPMEIDSSLRGRESRNLAGRLIAWRVVPLVSESMIRTENMDVLGMTAP